METPILCGLTDDENPEFLSAERALLEEITAQKGLSAEGVHTLRLKELPDPADVVKIDKLSRSMLSAFGLETQKFQTEFLEKDGFKFLAIYQKPPLRIRWQIPAMVFGGLVLLVILYYGLGFILTKVVNGQYADRNCQSLVGLAGFVEKAYPLNLAPFTWSAQEQGVECRAWLEAEALHAGKDWQKAFTASRKYEDTYPKGIHHKEAKDLAADSLFELSAAQHAKKEYSGAVDNLRRILDEYRDTASMSKAKETLPNIYLEWGAACRTNGEFEEAESAYLAMADWAAGEEKTTLVTTANTELAATYFEWGRDQQERGYFDLAATKFEKAIATDPQADSTGSTAAQTRDYLPGFQRAWGEHLVTKQQYSEAIRHFESCVKLSKPGDVNSAKNALSLAYLQWSESLRQTENFNDALDKIAMASSSAGTDANNAKIEAALSTTLDRYSRSTGTQAREVITGAVNGLCQTGKVVTTYPPIIGILPDKRLTVFGLNIALPSTILAQAPGNLYYVACAEEKQVQVQDCPYSSTGYYFIFAPYNIYRIRYDWVFKLYNAQTGALHRQKTFTGSSPATCPYTHSFFLPIEYYYGERPSITEVIDWLSYYVR